MSFNNFISFRRKHLDFYLNKFSKVFKNKGVLEIGAQPLSRRGMFRPPTNTKFWHTANINKKFKVDYVTDVMDLSIKNSIYDVVLSCEVLEYVDDPNKAISEMTRVLNKGGTLIFSVPFIHALHGDYSDDKFRFTSSYLKKELSEKFKDIIVIPMGGLYSSIYDLIYSYFNKRFYLFVLIMPLMILATFFDNPNNKITTGFFVVAKNKI